MKMNEIQGHDHKSLHVHQLALQPDFHTNQSIKQELLNFRTGDVHVYMVLLPEEYIQNLFKIANFFGLLDNHNVWIIPDYKDNGFGLKPVKTIRFNLLQNYEKVYKIPSVLDSVLEMHQAFDDQENVASQRYFDEFHHN